MGNNHFVITASGKVLKGDLRMALQAWRRLPASEREPGGITIEARGKLDPKRRSRLEPPKGGLVLRVFMRALERDPENRLYAPKIMALAATIKVPSEPQRDFMWLTNEEWKSMVPRSARKGSEVAVPLSVRNRLFRYHLMDACCTISAPRLKEQVFTPRMKLRVEDVSSDQIRLRLTGSAKVGGTVTNSAEFQLLGFLTYDVKKKRFTRFDMVAFSETGHSTYESSERLPKPMPMGIAFELASDAPHDRVPPRGTMEDRAKYLQTNR